MCTVCATYTLWTVLGMRQLGLAGSPIVPPPPRGIELRVAIGAWNLEPGGSVLSVGVTDRHRSWLATEVSLDGGRPDALDSRYALLLGDVRLAPPSVQGKTLFFTAGLAVASGLGFGASPMIGGGLESAWAGGLAAARVEIQRFSRGHGLRDAGRVLLGVVVALP